MVMSPLKIIISLVHPLNARHQISPVDFVPHSPRKLHLQLTPIPGRELDRHQHHPRFISPVRHAGMPEAEVPDDKRTLGQTRLDGRARLPPLPLEARPDLILLRIEHAGVRVGVRPQPDLGRAVLRGDVHEVDVDAVPEWDLGEVKVHVDVWRLPPRGLEGRVCAIESQCCAGAKHTLYHVGSPWVGDDVLEDVAVLEDWLLLDVARALAEVAMRSGPCIQILGFWDHPCIQLVKVFDIDGVLEYYEAILVKRLDGRLKVVRAYLFGSKLLGRQLNELCFRE